MQHQGIILSKENRIEAFVRITDEINVHGLKSVKQNIERLPQDEKFFSYPGNELIAALLTFYQRGEKEAVLTQLEQIIAGLQQQPQTTFDLLVVNSHHHPEYSFISYANQSDKFHYQEIVISSFEEAVMAVYTNGKIQSVLLYEGQITSGCGKRCYGEELINKLVQRLKYIRPEIDIFVVASSHRASQNLYTIPLVEKVFYQNENSEDIHLNILKGIENRYKTPFFSALMEYANRPVNTFHALPLARAKSLVNSAWIKDFADFYGTSMFKASSSATTGGLDSLLEPKSSIKEAQELYAKAFGAEKAYFVTNGTSDSNKVVEMGLLTEGDIVLMDRDCHKSHHYGMQHTGAFPLYVDAYPLQQYSMYGGVPTRNLKEALLQLKAEGRLDKAKMVVLTNCTFDGHVYNPLVLMQELLAIKPDLYFLWDEAWFAYAYFSPFLRTRTAMGATNLLKTMLKDPAYKAAYLEQRERIGELSIDNPLAITERLLCDPEQVRLRVYQTHSTHKSMSALRQASAILVNDQDYEYVEENLHEAVFSYYTTSPNQHIIGSIDIARRQMVFEGYERVMNATALALQLSQAINNDPLIAKYFKVLTNNEMIPKAFRRDKVPTINATVNPGCHCDESLIPTHDEFILDPTRVTLVTGLAGFDGTSFKNLLMEQYDIQINKTSRNSILIQLNINNSQSDCMHVLQALSTICRQLAEKYPDGHIPNAKALMEDVPPLPNFSRFYHGFTVSPTSKTVEGDIRAACIKAKDPNNCEYIPLFSSELDERLKNGEELVAAMMTIPYPPGFPILVPGQIVTQETIAFMRALDVQEIHGYKKELGLKLLKTE